MIEILRSNVPHSCKSKVSGRCFDCVLVSCNELLIVLPSVTDEMNNSSFSSVNMHEPGSVKSMIFCAGLEIKCLSHMMSCADHMSNLLLYPANFSCSITYHFQSDIKGLVSSASVLSIYVFAYMVGMSFCHDCLANVLLL